MANPSGTAAFAGLVERLDPDQLQAFQLLTSPQSRSSRVVMLAPPGVGKTSITALVHAYWVEDGANPGDIVVISFTAKTCDRYRTALNEQLKHVRKRSESDWPISTIHSLCLRWLKDWKEYDLRDIVDEYDREDIMLDAWKAVDRCAEFEFKAAELLTAYDALRRLELPMNKPQGDDPAAAMRARVFVRFRSSIDAQHLMDFHDIEYDARDLLANNAEFRARVAHRCRNLVVDEAQDQTALEWDIVKLLLPFVDRAVVCGDPDQSLYEFRGASPTCFVEFAQQDGWHRQPLRYNHRNAANIGKAATIMRNAAAAALRESRLEEPQFARQEAMPIWRLVAQRPADEVRSVLAEIRRSIDTGLLVQEDHTIICRSQADANRFIERAAEFGLDIRLGGMSKFDDPLVAVVHHYLRLLVDERHREAAYAVLNKPQRGFNALVRAQLGFHRFREDAPCSIAELRQVKHPVAKGFVAYVDELKRSTAGKPARECLGVLIERLGADLKRQALDVDRARLFLSEISCSDEGVRDYLARLDAMRDADARAAARSLTVWTFPKCKGAEWPIVWLVGLVDGRIPRIPVPFSPLKRAALGAAEREDIWRDTKALYTGMTRAKYVLCLSHYTQEGANFKRFGSSLLDLIPPELVRSVRGPIPWESHLNDVVDAA